MASGRKAVVLLSGGLDSATVLAIAIHEGYQAHALSFRYGQRHVVELAAARRVAEKLGASGHQVVDIDLRAFGGSALTDDTIAVPHGALGADPGIPVTYVLNQRDRPIPPSLQAEMIGRLPNPPRVIRLDTGHLPAVTHPDALMKAMAQRSQT